MTLSVQIVLLILGAAVAGAFGMRSWLIARGFVETRAIALHRKFWEDERAKKQSDLLRWIRSWANENMETVPKGCVTMDRMILVRYEDLLKVWDLTVKIEEHL